MDLGLENIKPMSTGYTEADLVAVFENCSIADQVFAAEFAAEDKMNMVCELVKNIKDLPAEQKKAVIDFFSKDKTMKTLIEASEEGQKWQDFFRWGVSGLLIGLYLGSFNRIRKVLGANPSYRMDTVSQYLPMESDMKSILEACESFLNALKSGNTKAIIDTANKHGAKIDSATDTDWVSALTSFALGKIGQATGIGVLGVAGIIGGKYVSEKARTKVGDKGYTEQKCADYAKRILKLIDLAESLKNAKANIPSEAKGVYDKLFKITCQAISTVGRGLCAATSKNI